MTESPLAPIPQASTPQASIPQDSSVISDDEAMENYSSMLVELEGKEPSVTDEIKSYIQTVNQGINNTLGAPADMTNLLLSGFDSLNPYLWIKESMPEIYEQLPVPDFMATRLSVEQPLLGAKHLHEIAKKYNVTSDEKLGSSWVHRAARITGETLPVVGAMLSRGATMARAGTASAVEKEAVSNVNTRISALDEIFVSMYSRPYMSLGIEAASVAGATVGGELAKGAFPDNPTGEALGELMFGIATPLAPLAVMKGFQVLPTVKVAREAFSKSGAERRAGNRMKDQAYNVENSLREVSDDSILKLTPFTASGDEGLSALFKASVEQDHKLASRVAELTKQSMITAEKEILGNFNASQADTDAYLSAMRNNVAARSQADLMKVDPNISVAESSNILRGHIENGLKGARVLESQIWSKVDPETPIDLTPVVREFATSMQTRAMNEALEDSDIPKYLLDRLGKLDAGGVFVEGSIPLQTKMETAKTLRSKISAMMGKERAENSPNREMLSELGKVQDSLYNVLKQASTGDDGNSSLKTAIDYSAKLNETYTKGKVGQMLGYSESGVKAVAPDGSLTFLLSGNGSKRDTVAGIRQLREGIKLGDDSAQSALDSIDSGVKALFIEQTVGENGVVDAGLARRFLKSKSDILNEFPLTRKGVEDSIQSQTLTDEWYGFKPKGTASTFQKEKMAAALFLDESPEKSLAAVLRAKTSSGMAGNMKKLLDKTNLDARGTATEGVKATFGQYLLSKSKGANSNISGYKLKKELDSLRPAAQVLYGSDASALKRLDQVAAELIKIERMQAANIQAAKGGVMNDMPNKIISIIGGSLAASAGGKFASAAGGGAGGGIRAAGLASGAWARTSARLTNDGATKLILQAVEDPDVFKLLLSEATPENQAKALKLMSAFGVGSGATQEGNGQQEQELSDDEVLMQFLNQE